MEESSERELHIHIHEGASPEAVRAAVQTVQAGGPRIKGSIDTPEVDPDKLATYTARAYTDSTGQAKPLLEFMADNPERLIPYTEISAHLGFPTARSLPGLLGSFGRRAKHRYEGKKPFDEVWENNQWHLRMSKANADIINGLR